MAREDIKVRPESGSEPITITYDFGASLDAMVKKFGEKIVFSNAKANMVVGVQGFARSQLKQDIAVKDLQGAVDKWAPGEKKRGKSPQEKLQEQFGKLSKEQKDALLAELSDSLG
jgi:hypothetical protein